MKDHTTKMRQAKGGILSQMALPLAMLAIACACLIGAQSVSASSRADKSHLRVVNASPKASSVDIYVDGKKVLSDFSFGKVSDYDSLSAGKHEIKVAPAGKGENDAIMTASANVAPKGYYTIAATGTKQGDMSLKAFKDNNTGNTKEAKARVYNLSPDLGAINVKSGNKTLIKNLNYEQASDYVTFPAGSHTLEATATHTDKKLPIKADAKAGKVYSVFVLGQLKGQPPLTYKEKTTDMKSSSAAGTPTTTATSTATTTPRTSPTP